MVTASGVRIRWVDLPRRLRDAVEEVLGSPVVSAVSQPGGFSPGTADRVVTADGRRAFVKAVSPAQNPDSPAFHRREARVTGALAASAPAPRLLGVHDDGTWVALVLEDVEGRHPATPWLREELDAVLVALAALAAQPVPPSLADLPTTAGSLAVDLAGWSRLAEDPPADLDPWAVRHLPDLVALGAAAPAALEGTCLVHGDVRADNLLVRADGAVVVVDWPAASTGAAWFDTLALLVNVRLHGGHDVEALLAHHAPEADGDAATAVLAGLTGYFLDAARQPSPPGLPTLRAFQAAQGASTLAWVTERASW